MGIKTRKIKLSIVSQDKADKKTKQDYILSCAEQLAKISNECVRYHINTIFDIDKIMIEDGISRTDAIKKIKSTLECSMENMGYRLMQKADLIPATSRAAMNRKIYSVLNKKFYDIINAKESLPSFRKNKITIPFNATTKMPLYEVENDIFIDFPTSRASEIKKISLKLEFGRDRSNNKAIVNRIFSKEYKMSDSMFLIDDKDIYLCLVFKQPDDNNVELDKKNVLGIDMGINYPVAIYVTDTKYQPQQLAVGMKIQHERQRIFKQRRQLQRTMKYNRGGHGRKRKISPRTAFSQYESNFATTYNHKISKDVVDIALRYKCGTIKMESLKNITKKTTDYFLKSWKYYQLQQFIEYKAKQKGIDVQYVDPKYTSQTCPSCKEVDEKNRDKTKFKCTNYLCEEYDKEYEADIIAAQNIAAKEQIKEKKSALAQNLTI